MTKVTSSKNPSVVGRSVTFTATVKTTGAPGSPVRTGTVQFRDGSTPLGAPVAVRSNGTASFTTSALSVGPHTIAADYSGTAALTPSTATLVQRVDPTATTTSLRSSANPSTFGRPVTFTAIVRAADAPGWGAPGSAGLIWGGTVEFFDGATSLGNVPVGAGGAASLTTGALGVGVHRITAVYGASVFGGGSSAVLWQTVAKTTTATKLTHSPTSSRPGDPVTFTATVTPRGGGAVGGGFVQFRDGNRILALAVAVAADGKATFTTSALAAGSHRITASYSGSAGLAASSASLTHSVTKPPKAPPAPPRPPWWWRW
ncbi:Ig-like domain repeat protein [Agromyces protaetiae]|uniref:Ig-like domain repeat protein n=1 Tax=Agromyces protaetiae TaxID=2509455 RepID=A0A4P6FQ49_9MICO|nr:Ig-like domain-containing protein [Agromyces protaetiae]QAY72648.1 Ig-like domain repeat protein [Agromyces protaetiae]